MDYTLSLTQDAAQTLQAHLLGDRSREQMAITLCGVNRLHHELRLLTRDIILLPPDAFRQQTASQLELKPEVQAFVHQRAHRHGLIQVDWHSHPGSGAYVGFSPTDDRHEAAQAAYLAHRMDGVPYGSVVVNDDALDARLWISQTGQSNGSHTYQPRPQPLQAILTGDLQQRIPVTAQRAQRSDMAAISPVFDRQVRAFGAELQRRLAGLRVGLVGLGGLGSALAEQLARLGVHDWVLVDPDVVDLTNLNRLVNATLTDAQNARPKVNVARSSIRQSNPKACVRALQSDTFDPDAQRALKACDLLIVATDNHASRMVINRLAVQYLIPLLHIGFNISAGEPAHPGYPPADPARDGGRPVTDISGEFAMPDLGRWCLHCAGLVDPQQAGWELAPAAQRDILRQRGYVADTPAPAVRHLDGLVASLAAAEIHNLALAYKPQQRYLVYDALRSEIAPLQVTASEHCPVCSAEQGVLGLGDLEPLPDYRRARHVPLPPLLSAPAPLPAVTAVDAESQSAVPADLPDGRTEEVSPGETPQSATAASPDPTAPAHQAAEGLPTSPDDPLPERQSRVRRLQAAMAADDGADPDWP